MGCECHSLLLPVSAKHIPYAAINVCRLNSCLDHTVKGCVWAVSAVSPNELKVGRKILVKIPYIYICYLCCAHFWLLLKPGPWPRGTEPVLHSDILGVTMSASLRNQVQGVSCGTDMDWEAENRNSQCLWRPYYCSLSFAAWAELPDHVFFYSSSVHMLE